MRVSFTTLLIILSLGCSNSALQQQIDVAGVGVFSLETIDGFDDYHHYACEIAGSGDQPLLVVIYPDRDVIPSTYADWIRATVTKVAAEQYPMIDRAEPKIRALMDQYGLELPENFSTFVEAQRLTHIKVSADGAEVIYDTCSFFPNFSLNAKLDLDAEIDEVWFDG